MKYDLVIFDLDGTLLDTLEDLTRAVNHALALRGFPPRECDEVRQVIGNGIANIVRGAVPADTDDGVIRDTLADFRQYYLAHVNVFTRPYDGIVGLLDALNAAGVRCAVNSNKVDTATRALCEAHLGDRIALVLGEQPDLPRKPAPDGALAIMRALDAAPGRTLYVGDGETDLMTAQNAGTDSAWVSWGYRRREELGSIRIPRAFGSVRELSDFIFQDQA